MSDFTQKDGSGIFFKNNRKTKETQPDYTGSITVDGKKRSIAGWIKQGKKGPFMSLAVKEWEDNAMRKPAKSEDFVPKQESDFQDDSIPF